MPSSPWHPSRAAAVTYASYAPFKQLPTAPPPIQHLLTRRHPQPATNRLDVTGFQFSAASIESLERIDLTKIGGERPLAALILDRDDLPAAKAWAGALESRGAEVQYEALSGFNDMVSTPHAAQVPTAMLEAVTRWLLRDNSAATRLAEMAAKRLPAGGAHADQTRQWGRAHRARHVH